ncbi:MAG TPA: Ser-Thr-rich GPI-anchored membrane family protein [Chitinispirillaceae bacterium]|nr:Ser-Thr-rich GPI-anchored membrane family protein [Chitinispirillaceae bacterium]
MFTSSFSDAGAMIDLKRKVNPFGKGGLVDKNTPLQRLQKITLHKKNLLTGLPETETIKEIDFTYDYSLCKGTLNSDADDDANQYLGGGPGDLDADGKLTLNSVWIKGRNGEAPLSPYIFSYVREKHEAVDNPNYGYENWDRWGYYKYDGKEHLNTNAGLVGAWSLRSIFTPLGAKLDIEYESDDYARVQDSIAGDALFYEGDEVPVEYEYDGLSNNNIKCITVPINVVGTSGVDICRLRSGDRIEFNADLAKIRFTQADYTRFVTEIEKKYEQIKKKPIIMVLGIASTILAGLDCAAQCGLPLPGPLPNCSNAAAGGFCQACLAGEPLSCLICQAQCSKECFSNCGENVADCMETILNVGHDGIEEKAKIFASILGDYVNIPYNGIVSNVEVLNDHFDLDDEPKKVKITFANPISLNLKAGIGITDNLRKWFGDPLKFYDHYDCGDFHGSDEWINLGDDIKNALLRELAGVLANAGLFDGLEDIFGGAGSDIFFPMSSTLESLIGNNGLHLKIKKIQPSDVAIQSQLKTGTKATLLDKDNFFATKYHNVKAGGGLRVKSIKLDDGNGNAQQWNYHYDFLGNGTGITSGVATSEPMPFGPEGMDDRVFRQEDDGNFYMASPVVRYEKVTVISPDGSKTVSEFATPAEYPYIKNIGDNDNFSHKYFDPSMIYGKMKKKEYFAVSETTPVYSEVYDYETTHYANAQIDPDDDDMGALVSASNVAIRNENNVDGQLPLGTIREEYQNYLMDMTITNLGLSVINFAFGGIRHNCFQYDIPGFPIRKVTTMKDGATKVVRNLIWDKYGGHPLLVAEQNSGNKWKLTEETPGYHINDNNALFGKNMLNQVYQTTMYNYSGAITDVQSLNPAAILTAASPVQSNVQTWSSDASVHNWMSYSAGKIFAPAFGTWVTPTSSIPAQIYKTDTWNWNVKPTTPGKSFTFTTSNDQWLNTAHVNRYDRYGKELEVSNSNGTTVSIVRGNGNEFVNAEIANADFKESSVYTGDYDEGGTYLDYDDAWGRGQYKAVGSTTLSPASVTIKTGAKHFGEAGVEVTNAYGPTRAFKLQPQRDYIFSAWIKVVDGNPDIDKNIVMGVDYRRLNGDEGWPLNLYTTDVVPALPCSGKLKVENGADGWKLITMNVPAKKDISSIKWRAGYNYAAAWVGVPNGDNKGGNATVYIDDVRFYPKDASVKSYYYDKTIGKPIAFVDENDKAKFYEYEVLGRLQKILDNSRALVQRFDYSIGKIRIIKPSFKQVFPVSGVLPIKWVYWRPNANLKYYLSADNGNTWPPEASPFTTHTQTTSGADQITWNIPASTTPGTEYRLKIVDESDLGTYDISERFTIANRAVLAPVEGDVIDAGTTLRIEWVYLGAQTVDVYYMEDGTIPHKIASNVVSSTISGFNWPIPADLQTDRHATIKIVGYYNGGNILTPDAVSGVFTINGRSNFILKWLFGFQNYR